MVGVACARERQLTSVALRDAADAPSPYAALERISRSASSASNASFCRLC